MTKLFTKEDVIEVRNPELDSKRKALNDEITSAMERVSNEKKVPKIYFVNKKAKHYLDIKNTSLQPKSPNRANFKENYREQIESIIFNPNDTIDPEALFPILIFVENVVKGRVPMRVVNQGFNKTLPQVVEVLNGFYNEHELILKGIYEMFRDSYSTGGSDVK